MIVTGTTASGFEYSVDVRRVTDFRYVRVLSKLSDESVTDAEKVLYSVEAVEFLLGKDGVDDLCDHIAEAHDGYAPSDLVIAEALEINTFVASKNTTVKN